MFGFNCSLGKYYDVQNFTRTFEGVKHTSQGKFSSSCVPSVAIGGSKIIIYIAKFGVNKCRERFEREWLNGLNG